MLSCIFHTEKDTEPRIEWKKKGKDVSFVYYDGQFKGVKAACCSSSPRVAKRAFVLISLQYQLEVVAKNYPPRASEREMMSWQRSQRGQRCSRHKILTHPFFPDPSPLWFKMWI